MFLLSAKSLHKPHSLFNGSATNQDVLHFVTLQYLIISHLHFWGMSIQNEYLSKFLCYEQCVSAVRLLSMHAKYFGYKDWWLLSQGFYLHYHKAEKICRYTCLHILTKCSNEYSAFVCMLALMYVNEIMLQKVSWQVMILSWGCWLKIFKLGYQQTQKLCIVFSVDP